MSHERHPDCLIDLPVDSCHWDGCEQGESADQHPCYHQAGWPEDDE